MQKMLDPKWSRSQEVRFVFSGLGTVLKSVTKTTTCDDVIRKLPPQPARIAVYESVNGVERELSGKTRLLKVWRAHGSTAVVYFVIKKSGEQTRNMIVKRKLFSGFYQKSKHDAYACRRKQTNTDKTSVSHIHNADCKYVNSSLDSLDSSIAENDENEMFRVMTSSGATKSNSIGATPTSRIAPVLSRNNRHEVMDSLHTMKLGFRKDLTSNESLHSRINNNAERTKRKAVDEPESFGNPRHSTPLIGAPDHPSKRSRVHLASTPTVVKASGNCRTANHSTRKTVLVDEFAADEILSSMLSHDTSCGTTSSRASIPEFRTSSRAMIPEFRKQEERFRYIWNRNCDIDSDSSFDSDTSCAGSQLDVALWDPARSPTPGKRIESYTKHFSHSLESTYSHISANNPFDISYCSHESSVFI